ncbi:hypothetical protein M8997_003865 [Phyllobacterium sp. 21LDTY02-6]|uniref:hypothetical protein n=1 Tax=Phyllobacterium sp. 21LDTY02-6 TaxID=2944903 RepID=UPI0020214634|nr:hypothetical protein [Phyllobacterium sp. 21LDTY02-6]MCO4316309.1 hypothetical protein [Phyllobacterium sp. 21LDTY02-6]
MKSLIDSIYELITRETDEGPVYDLSVLEDANTQITFLSLLADLNFKAGRRPGTATGSDDLITALRQCQSILAVLIDPKHKGSGISNMVAWSNCVAAEAKARTALARVGS